MSLPNNNQPARKPAPLGCNRPVMAHLTSDERSQLERIASLEMRTLSATARMLIIQGLQSYTASAE